jgi:hypothetical protein
MEMKFLIATVSDKHLSLEETRTERNLSQEVVVKVVRDNASETAIKVNSPVELLPSLQKIFKTSRHMEKKKFCNRNRVSVSARRK